MNTKVGRRGNAAKTKSDTTGTTAAQDGVQKSRALVAHPKKRKINGNTTSSKNLKERLDQLSCSANPADREELLQLLLTLHERFSFRGERATS
jgi:hypothetical protein